MPKAPDSLDEFQRDTGCTEAEWLGWLPGACRDHPLRLSSGAAEVAIASGRLMLTWTVQPPRRIALIVLPRMLVCYRFEGLSAAERQEFMRYFDLFMQRGGG